jgi:hypothetical protein
MAEPFTRDLSKLTPEQRLEATRAAHEEIKRYGREIDWVREASEFEQQLRRVLAFTPKHMKLRLWMLQLGMESRIQEALLNRMPKELRDRVEVRRVGGGVEDVEGE